ncbi:MAG: VOC family protein [Bacillota bacterium]
MRIEHVAIWTRDLERLKKFYEEYFGGKAGEKYVNEKKGFESYFISFDTGARLEIMKKASIPENMNSTIDEYLGLIHLAFSVGSKEKVDELTSELRSKGYRVVSGPRTTGDGYYESCVLDPDGNRLEITE